MDFKKSITFNEENRLNWTRGDLNGKWCPSDDDVDTMFDPGFYAPSVTVARTVPYISTYLANGSMTPLMCTFEAYKYCLPLRERAIFKMKNIPWDINLLNAFHNLHFTLFMADMNPVLVVPGWSREGRPTDCAITAPGWQQLIYEAATKCVAKDFVKLTAKRRPSDFYVATLFARDHNSVGIRFGITYEGQEKLIYLQLGVTGEPAVQQDGTFEFKYEVDLTASTWDGVYFTFHATKPEDVEPSTLRPYTGPLKDSMVNMNSYVTRELERFTRKLADAEFNRPEYALKNINGGKL